MEKLNKKIDEINAKLKNLLLLKEQLEIQLVETNKELDQAIGAIRVLQQLKEESNQDF